MTRKIKLTAMAVLVSAMLPISAICSYAAVDTTIKVDNIAAESGSSVSVPIELSNNTGIAAATITITYDSSLTLTGVSKGTALSSLTMVPPGKLNANPIKIQFFAVEPDYTDGSIAVLTFTAPSEAGDYGIFVSYDEDDIIDGDLNSVNAKIEQGKITVMPTEQKVLAQNLGVFIADDGYEGDAVSSTAFKADLSGVSGTVSITITPDEGESHTFTSITTITNSDVILGIIVSGLADDKAIGEVTIN